MRYLRFGGRVMSCAMPEGEELEGIAVHPGDFEWHKFSALGSHWLPDGEEVEAFDEVYLAAAGLDSWRMRSIREGKVVLDRIISSLEKDLLMAFLLTVPLHQEIATCDDPMKLLPTTTPFISLEVDQDVF